MNKDELLDFLKEQGIRFAQEKLEAYLSNQNRQQTSAPQGERPVIEPEILEKNKYEDGDAFEANLKKELAKGAKDISPEQMLKFVFHLTKQVYEVQKFCEVQETKRQQINAIRAVKVKEIQAQKEVLMSYLEKSFDERKANFAKLFAVVDQAMVSNNNEQLALALHSINLLAADSPFKALRSVEETKKALEDKNHEWDF